MNAAHDTLDDFCRRFGNPAKIRISFESLDARASEAEIFDPSASVQACAALSTLPHYDDSELTLYAYLDDELRALAREE